MKSGGNGIVFEYIQTMKRINILNVFASHLSSGMQRETAAVAQGLEIGERRQGLLKVVASDLSSGAHGETAPVVQIRKSGECRQGHLKEIKC